MKNQRLTPVYSLEPLKEDNTDEQLLAQYDRETAENVLQLLVDKETQYRTTPSWRKIRLRNLHKQIIQQRTSLEILGVNPPNTLNISQQTKPFIAFRITKKINNWFYNKKLKWQRKSYWEKRAAKVQLVFALIITLGLAGATTTIYNLSHTTPEEQKAELNENAHNSRVVLETVLIAQKSYANKNGGNYTGDIEKIQEEIDNMGTSLKAYNDNMAIDQYVTITISADKKSFTAFTLKEDSIGTNGTESYLLKMNGNIATGECQTQSTKYCTQGKWFPDEIIG